MRGDSGQRRGLGGAAAKILGGAGGCTVIVAAATAWKSVLWRTSRLNAR